jgi:hypothetical protein
MTNIDTLTFEQFYDLFLFLAKEPETDTQDAEDREYGTWSPVT